MKIVNYQVFYIFVCPFVFLFVLYRVKISSFSLCRKQLQFQHIFKQKHTDTSTLYYSHLLLLHNFFGPVHFWRICFFQGKISYLFVYKLTVAALRFLFQLTFMFTLYLIYLSLRTKQKNDSCVTGNVSMHRNLYNIFCKTYFQNLVPFFLLLLASISNIINCDVL